MLVYWLRSTCLLLIRQTDADVTAPFLAFSFPGIRRNMALGVFENNTAKALDRDYAVLAHVMSKTPVTIEASLLVWDYRLMRSWYALSRIAFPAQSRAALREVAD